MSTLVLPDRAESLESYLRRLAEAEMWPDVSDFLGAFGLRYRRPLIEGALEVEGILEFPEGTLRNILPSARPSVPTRNWRFERQAYNDFHATLGQVVQREFDGAYAGGADTPSDTRDWVSAAKASKIMHIRAERLVDAVSKQQLIGRQYASGFGHRHTTIHRDTQAVILLTVHFGKSSIKPLSVREWGRFAHWLKDHELEPSQLLKRDPMSLLSRWMDRTVIARDESATWLRALVAEIKAFAACSDVAHLNGGDNALLRIADLACSRLAIDFGEGEIDLRSLAVLGGVSEGRVRSLLSETDGPLERGPDGGIKALSAASWLQKKKGYLASVWQVGEPDFEEAGKTVDIDPERMIFVPVARDGSMFTSDLQRNGSYRIGTKGAEESHADFSVALSRLNEMAVPRWRRPNDNGISGIVSGVAWQRIEKK